MQNTTHGVLSAPVIKAKGPPRRSRAGPEGRDMICCYCQKGYLSANSLNQHVRTKHNSEPDYLDFIRSQFKSE